MPELLIIADDFTGALDTGVQFITCGMATRIFAQYTREVSLALEDVRVVVVNAETRHLPAQQAYDTVFRITADARRVGIRHIYKKTDSALRGNIGSELAAVLDGAGEDRLIFVPAFPRLNRVTKDGIHYIDGRPVAESVFGTDPFEPVRQSSVEKILNAQTRKATIIHSHPETELTQTGIHIFDARTDDDLDAIAQALRERVQLSAGCSAFAAALARQFGSGKAPAIPPCPQDSLLVLCGSKNPVTVRQLDEAEKAGYPRIRLTPEQKLFWDCRAGERAAQLQAYMRLAREWGLCMIDANDSDGACTDALARQNGMSAEATRVRIAQTLGQIGKELLESKADSTILCSGGDTLLAVMEAAGIRELNPIGELATGVVLAQMTHNGHTHSIISKSGGFGKPDLLLKLLGIRTEKERTLCRPAMN